MEPQSYIRSVLDRNVIMWCKTVQIYIKLPRNLHSSSLVMAVEADRSINRISMGETNTA